MYNIRKSLKSQGNCNRRKDRQNNDFTECNIIFASIATETIACHLPYLYLNHYDSNHDNQESTICFYR